MEIWLPEIPINMVCLKAMDDVRAQVVNVDQLKNQLYYSLNQADKLNIDEFEEDSDKLCPKCKVDMLKQPVNTYVVVPKCPKCKGIWLPDGQLKTVVSKTRETDLIQLESQPPDGKEDNDDFFHFNAGNAKFPCPDCRRHLREVYFKLDHNIKVDICEHCRGVFYDYGELTKVAHVIRENKKKKKQEQSQNK